MRAPGSAGIAAGALLLCGCAVTSTPAAPAPPSTWARPGAPVPAPAALAQDLRPFDAEGMARDARNPVADLFMFPMKYEANAGYGADGDVQNVFTLQPVVPFNLDDEWNLVTRTVFPFYYQPQGTDSYLFGTGETIFTTWFSRVKSEGLAAAAAALAGRLAGRGGRGRQANPARRLAGVKGQRLLCDSRASLP